MHLELLQILQITAKPQEEDGIKMLQSSRIDNPARFFKQSGYVFLNLGIPKLKSLILMLIEVINIL